MKDNMQTLKGSDAAANFHRRTLLPPELRNLEHKIESKLLRTAQLTPAWALIRQRLYQRRILRLVEHDSKSEPLLGQEADTSEIS